MNSDLAGQSSVKNAKEPRTPHGENNSLKSFTKILPLISIVILIVIFILSTLVLSFTKKQNGQSINTQGLSTPNNQTQQYSHNIQATPLPNTFAGANSQCGSLQPSTKYPGWTSFQDPSTCITFSYPSDWTLHATPSLKSFDLLKNGYDILIGIGSGNSPVEIYAAKTKNVQFLGKTLTAIYTYSSNWACNNFSGNTNDIITPVPSVCSRMFDAIVLAAPSCLKNSICTGESWPFILNWQFIPKRPTAAGVYIQFMTPSTMPLTESSSNPYISDYYKFITTVNLPQSIPFH